MSAFQIETTDNVTLVRLEGELTIEEARALQTALRVALCRPRELVIAPSALLRIAAAAKIRAKAIAPGLLAAGRNLDSYGIAAEDFWAESLFHGLLLVALAKETGAVSPDDEHTAGLLRYIGRLAINQSIDDLGGGLFWDAAVPVAEWELGNVGVTQEQAGAMLLKHWQFPDATVQAIEYQQEPERAPQPNWLAGALAFAAVVLPAGSESAKLGEVFASTVPGLEGHPFAQANKLAADRIAIAVEIARNGLSAVNQHLYG